MNSINLYNKSNKPLRFIIEPIAAEYSVSPGSQAKIVGDLDGTEVVYWGEEFIAIWVLSVVRVLDEMEEVIKPNI